MKKVKFILAGLLAALAASAAPVNCSTTGGALTLDRLLTGGDLVDGCIDQDKVYSNFTYTGATASDDIQFNFAFSVVAGQDIHTASFQGPWVADFQLGYTLSVTDPGRWISGVQVDFSRAGAQGTPTLSQSQTPPGAVNPLVATVAGDVTTSLPGQTQQLVVAIAGNMNGGGIAQITSTYTQSEIPEPATYALMGAGLLALGGLRRKLAQ